MLTRKEHDITIQGVNNFYSRPELYLPRWLTPSLRQASQDHAVIVLTGARQVGKSTLLMVPPARLYYWRQRSGPEVDFVVERGRRLLGVEVKMSAQVSFKDTVPLRQFLEEYPQASGGLLLYQGTAVRRLGEKILAVPWTLLAG